MGTPWRSKKFHEAYYGDMGDNTLPDQVAGMRELARRYPWIDLDRAGIYGHSGGGYATADAMFRYPDFFKVGISEAGNHDNRNYEDDWAEKWQGLLQSRPDGTTIDSSTIDAPIVDVPTVSADVACTQLAASYCKAAVIERCRRVTASAHQLAGGQGILADTPFHRWFRRVKTAEPVLGTNRHHRARIAASLLDH